MTIPEPAEPELLAAAQYQTLIVRARCPIGTMSCQVRTETGVNSRRITALMVGSSLLFAACGGGGGGTSSAAADIELSTQAPVQTEEVADASNLPDPALAGVDEVIEAAIVETNEQLTALADECAAAEARVQPNADFSNRRFTGPDLRCADLSGASFENAVLDGVDLSGANLSGANFTGATLNVVAMGVDFTRAIFEGADLQQSDLRGSTMVAADLRGSIGTDNVVGMMMVDLTGAQFGCNIFYGAPAMNLSGVSVTSDCQSDLNWARMTLRGSFYASQMVGMDFEKIAVETTDFRRADLTGANFFAYGILPTGIDFSGSLLTQADLSSVGLDEAGFVGADLSFANLSDSYSVSGDFTVAVLNDTNLTNFTSERNSYVGASLVGTTMSNVTMAYDDLTDAEIADVISDGLTMDTVKCPGAASGDRYGLCTVGTEVAF